MEQLLNLQVAHARHEERQRNAARHHRIAKEPGKPSDTAHGLRARVLGFVRHTPSHVPALRAR
jgi:hypothetical protein